MASETSENYIVTPAEGMTVEVLSKILLEVGSPLDGARYGDRGIQTSLTKHQCDALATKGIGVNPLRGGYL